MQSVGQFVEIVRCPPNIYSLCGLAYTQKLIHMNQFRYAYLLDRWIYICQIDRYGLISVDMHGRMYEH